MILTVHVKPNARETHPVSWLDAGTLVLAVAAPPVDGKANEEIVHFLSKSLKIPKSFLSIKRGQTGRVKHIEMPDGTSLKPLDK